MGVDKVDPHGRLGINVRQLTVSWVLDAIKEDRKQYGACTSVTIARRTGFSVTLVQRRLREAKEAGLILWDPRITGSIRLKDQPDPFTPA